MVRRSKTVFRVRDVPNRDEAIELLEEEINLESDSALLPILEEELSLAKNPPNKRNEYPAETAFVRAAVRVNLSPDERTRIEPKIEIIPDCTSNSDRKCALLHFSSKGARNPPQDDSSVPSFMLDDKKPKDKFPLSLGEEEMLVDNNFYGLTQLYKPKEGGIAADIIAVTGLAGHAWGSWKDTSTGQMWLRDFLPNDLPNCRTMIYGYDSRLQAGNISTILDHGRTLREEIKKVRTENEDERPLIFIGHSFGGLLIAQSLVKSRNEKLCNILKPTKALMFFGTPHKGLIVTDVVKKLQNDSPSTSPSVDLLKTIDENSILLENQLADFTNIIGNRKVYSFYEQRRRTLGGDPRLATDRHSALLQLPDRMEEKIPVNGDHSTMVKFDSKKNTTYESAVKRLNDCLEAQRPKHFVPMPSSDGLEGAQ